MNTPNLDERLECITCRRQIQTGVTFCHACGAYQNHEITPSIFVKTQAQIRKSKTHSIIGTIIFILSILLFPVLLILLIGPIFMLRRGVKCPACNSYILSRILKNPTSIYCYNCGVRILPGVTGIPNFYKNTQDLSSDHCGFCGHVVTADDIYCTSCGVNLWQEIDNCSLNTNRSSDICPCCKRYLPALTIRRFPMSYCVMCGIQLQD